MISSSLVRAGDDRDAAGDRRPRSSAPLTSSCAEPNGLTGLPSISSCSLAKAMFEPQKETEPTIAAKQLKIAT